MKKYAPMEIHFTPIQYEQAQEEIRKLCCDAGYTVEQSTQIITAIQQPYIELKDEWKDYAKELLQFIRRDRK